MADRGVDGLTAEELQRGRKNWWEIGFTRVFADALPAGTRRVLEIGCGTGYLGVQLLSVRPELEYLGVDLDAPRVAQARAAIGAGARVLVGRAESLPFATGSLDAVLTSMTLMHLPAPLAGLAEALRVLRPGGVLVAAEPDNLSQRWYYDGLAEDVTAAFSALFHESRRRHLPADIAIGPRVATLARTAGFADVAVRVHAGFTTHHETAEEIAKRWRWVLGVLAGAGGFDQGDPLVADCERAIATFVATAPPGRGQGGDVIPTFVTMARKTG